MQDVMVFRHQLFKISEPFIAQQGGSLRNYRSIYVGRERFGSAPRGAISFALGDLWGKKKLLPRARQVITRDPRPYLRLLEGQKFALIHAHFGVEGVYALPLAKKLRVPLVTTFHGFDATTKLSSLVAGGSPSWMNYAFFRTQLKAQGDLFLCVSEYIRQRVIELGFPEDRTFLHYIGIDTKLIQPRSPGEERPIILHVARLVEKKGTEYLIRAFAQIEKRIPGVELVIIGDGPLRVRLEARVQSQGLEEKVRFLGACSHEDVMTIMRMATMLVLTSVTARTGDAEGLGMVLLEAAAVGVPLIGTLHGGIPEAIIDEKTGYLVPERDVNALAERMLSLLLDTNLRLEMGEQARALVESRFDIRTQTERLERFYGGVIS